MRYIAKDVILDERLRKEQETKIEETDRLMDMLLQHPKIREAFKEVVLKSNENSRESLNILAPRPLRSGIYPFYMLMLCIS